MSKALLLSLFCAALGNVLLHNPRGSNNRLNEDTTRANNTYKLFSSQNSDRGGYGYGSSANYYYEDSLLATEFTLKHGCGTGVAKCIVVLQYMCSSSSAEPIRLVRDGTTTDTIPNDANGPFAKDANGELKYGMHEPRDWYNACETRERNKGLWIADRADPAVGNLNGNGAVVTRQNNYGTRYAYECPEERDYYPYWVASPWKDIAVITDDVQFCPNYRNESQNVKSRFRCETLAGVQAPQIQQPECLSAGNRWVEQPAWNIAAPECLSTASIKVNPNGLATYVWRLPTATQEPCIASAACSCALRIRYNVTGGNIVGGPFGGFVDSNSNGANSPITQRMIGDYGYSLPFWLSIDSSTYSSVYQDRSFTFGLKPKPAGVGRIFNLNVKGKRGTPGQVFPALTYGFAPDSLSVNVGDYIHFQWTGCDTNPSEFSGEGTGQTDRSNIVQIESLDKNVPALTSWIDTAGRALFPNVTARYLLAYLDQISCLSYQQLKVKNANNMNNVETDVQNCMRLNAAARYFDGGLVKMNTPGQFYFMSTRNNLFGNNHQKGTITVT